MRYRMVQLRLFPLLFTVFLLVSKPEAKNYVILSMTKEGLRELRMAYRGRLVLETSLMAGTSESGLAFSRASDDIRLVETVVRDGLIEDCAIMDTHKDLSSFISDFSRVRPDKTLVNESDIMDVYLGNKNITDPIFIAKHSSKTPHNMTSSAMTNYENITEGSTAGINLNFKASKNYHHKLTAKIISPHRSEFMQKFRRHFRIKKTARECRQFYSEAKKNFELLTYLTEQPEEEAHAALRRFLNMGGGGDQTNSQHTRYRYRHHHRHHNFQGKTDNDKVVSYSESISSSNSWQQTLQKNTFEKFQLKDTEDNNIEKNITAISTDSLVQTEVDSGADRDGNMSKSTLQLSSSQLSNIQSSVIQPYYTQYPNIQSSHLQSSNKNGAHMQSSNLQASSDVQSYNSHENTTGTLTPFLSTDDVKHDNATPRNAAHTVRVMTSDDEESSQWSDDAVIESEEYMADSPSAYLSSRSRSKRDLLTGWMIFPGTKWCGDGDIAEHKKDLGYHTELDKCCRRHDLCPLVIPRLSWKYGMFNFRLHTISHCRCDRKFRKCLKSSNSPLAHLIGQIFFNVVGPQCFKFNKETTCLQRFWWGGCREWGESKVAYVKKQRQFK